MPDRVPTDGQHAKPSGQGLKAGIFALASIITIVIAIGSVTIVAQLNSLQTDVASARRELAAAKDKIARLEQQFEGFVSAQNRAQAHLDRPNDGVSNSKMSGKSQSPSPLELSREEVQLLRDYIKVPPASPGSSPTISVGAAVPIGMLMPLPSQISDKVPKLIGARFMTDHNGAIVIVRRGSQQADAVVNPN